MMLLSVISHPWPGFYAVKMMHLHVWEHFSFQIYTGSSLSFLDLSIGVLAILEDSQQPPLKNIYCSSSFIIFFPNSNETYFRPSYLCFHISYYLLFLLFLYFSGLYSGWFPDFYLLFLSQFSLQLGVTWWSSLHCAFISRNSFAFFFQSCEMLLVVSCLLIIFSYFFLKIT